MPAHPPTPEPPEGADDAARNGIASVDDQGAPSRGCVGRRERGTTELSSVAVERLALLLGPTKAGLGAVVRALEFSEPSRRRRARAVHLRPVQVIALAVVAGLGPQVLDRCRIGHYSPRLRASWLRSR